MVYTVEAHRRKGYAQLAVASLVDYLLSHQMPPYCYIVPENQPSMTMFAALGFVYCDESSWGFTEPKRKPA
jgi:predicted GNAT family acetyltransferase